jgi:plasmid rolling circle replication initiator protein Rep
MLIGDELRENFHTRKIASLTLADSYFRIDLRRVMEDGNCPVFKELNIDINNVDFAQLRLLLPCGNKKMNKCTQCAWQRSKRVRGCGAYLEYKIDPNGLNQAGYQRLTQAYLCADILCPLCQWRKSRKATNQLVVILKELTKYRFIFLTLTIRNVDATELNNAVHILLRVAWKNLINNRRFKKAIEGYYRTFEVTHDTEPIITAKMFRKKRGFYIRNGLKIGDINPTFDTFHPHLHVLLAVDPSYFDKGYDLYIKHKTWKEMWQKALGADYEPFVHVRVVYEKE